MNVFLTSSQPQPSRPASAQASKRFQLFALSVLVAVGAVLTGDLHTSEMWAQLRQNAAAYLLAIVAVQAPAEAVSAFRQDPDSVPDTLPPAA